MWGVIRPVNKAVAIDFPLLEMRSQITDALVAPWPLFTGKTLLTFLPMLLQCSGVFFVCFKLVCFGTSCGECKCLL